MSGHKFMFTVARILCPYFLIASVKNFVIPSCGQGESDAPAGSVAGSLQVWSISPSYFHSYDMLI